MPMKSRTRKLILNVATSVAILLTAVVVLTPASAFAAPPAQDQAAASATAAPGTATLRYTGR